MATYSHKLNVVFYHIPKCAGLYIESLLLTSSENFFTYNFRKNDFIDFYHNKESGIRREFHRHHEMFKISKAKIDDMFEFTFVRNPYVKFISAWFYCKSNKFEANNFINNKILEDLEELIENIDMINDLTFFHMFKTQSDNIRFHKDMNFIGKVENLKDDLNTVFGHIELIGTEITDEKVNENPIEYGDYRKYITPKVLEFINEHFSEDFERFEYRKVFTIEDLPVSGK